MQVDDISQQYIALAFAIERHFEGFVDGYYGPPELKTQALADPQPLLDAIAADIERLRDELRQSGYPQRRKNYIGVQLDGMTTTVRKLMGETLSYRDEVRGCFDIEPAHTPEDRFEAAIAQLDELLPGSGSIQERMTNWKRRFEVSAPIARQMIDRIAAEARTRSAAFGALPADETVSFELVSDKPWGGYNWYFGGHRSLVEINTDLPLRADRLLELVCHEAYPGHHTEHAFKEHALYEEQNWGEHSILLMAAPECVISEGIATLAAEMIFGDDESAWLEQQIFPLAGIDVDAERVPRISAAMQAFGPLGANAALLLHENGAAPEEIVAYVMRYGLRTEREARQTLRFITNPLSRAYVFTYDTGYALLSRWLRRGDRQARFSTLLHEQVYPSLVEGWIIEEERNCVRG